MKKLRLLLVIITTFTLISPIKAVEMPDMVDSANDTITTGIEEKYYDEIQYKSGERVTSDKNINGTNFVVGTDVTIKNDTKGVLFTAGNIININSSSDYALIAGNTIELNGNVRNDGFIAGNIVKINKEAIIERDLNIAASQVTIEGTIERDLNIFASSVMIKNADIKGNVKINASSIVVESSTNIAKELKHGQSANVEISKEAKIGSIVTYDDTVKKATFMEMAYAKLTATCTTLVAFAVLALALPSMFKKINESIDNMKLSTPLINAGKGALLIIVIPLIVILLLFTVFASSVSMILLGLYILWIYLSNLLTAYIIGYIIWKKLIKKESNVLLSGLMGIMTMYVLSLIPYLNNAIAIASLLIGFGTIYELIKSAKVIGK